MKILFLHQNFPGQYRYLATTLAADKRIQVVGFRRQVDWPTLLARLEVATEGQAPIIQ